MAELHLLHLYPNELNTYGDHGNSLTLQRRIERHGLKPVVHHHHPGGKLPARADIVIGGGGQDSAQADVQKDILKIGGRLRKMAESGVPMVLICGTYQLFGNRFITNTGKEIKGIGIFDMETVGGQKRLIGNLMVKSDFGLLFGFENHSGQTFLGKDQRPLGKVRRGNGNNGRDKTEGARTNNAFGTYMHGPFLPNNPQFCDEIIRLAAVREGISLPRVQIDDSLALQARSAARRRKY
ncbi:MAG TPA: glutamine amidotransferase [Candidatus Saccharimonadales bacterium]|nr:glutamine amidotransferase [Candidatus Saccharimonadales bacterium]